MTLRERPPSGAPRTGGGWVWLARAASRSRRGPTLLRAPGVLCAASLDGCTKGGVPCPGSHSRAFGRGWEAWGQEDDRRPPGRLTPAPNAARRIRHRRAGCLPPARPTHADDPRRPCRRRRTWAPGRESPWLEVTGVGPQVVSSRRTTASKSRVYPRGERGRAVGQGRFAEVGAEFLPLHLGHDGLYTGHGLALAGRREGVQDVAQLGVQPSDTACRNAASRDAGWCGLGC
jgi:hypothetical protein